MYTLDVLVNDKPITIYKHKNTKYVEGRPGSEFKLRIKNRSSDTVKVIVSVDGLSVIDGRPAGNDSPGYIVHGYNELIIPGWTLNQSQVAAFEFAKRSSNKTYVERLKSRGLDADTNNIGIFGLMVFRTIPKYVPPPSPFRDYTWDQPWFRPGELRPESRWTGLGNYTDLHNVLRGPVTSTTLASSSVNSIGTAQGRDVDFQTTTVNVDVEPNPCWITTIEYDDAAGLEARGIVVEKRMEIASRKRAFPNYNVTYAKDLR